MSEQKRKTVYLQGKLFFAKVLDAPRPNYDGDAREWTFEFEPDEASVEVLREHELADRLKTGRKQDGTMRKNYENRNPFLILRRGEFKTTGERNDKIRVVDSANQEWSSRMKIGNETVADVKVQIVDWGPRKKKGIYPLAIRIHDAEYVPYVPQEFDALPDDDPNVQAARARDDEFRRDFGLADQPEEQEEPEAEIETIPDPTGIDDTEETPDEDPLDDEVPV